MSYADEIMKSLENLASSMINSTESMLGELRTTREGEKLRDLSELRKEELIRC